MLATRLCHLRIVWVEEAYPAAAALQMLHGRMLYRDIWFDKPPLSALMYLLWGAETGLAPRLAGALYVTLACWIAYRFARDIWGEREGRAAATFLAFFLTFGIPSAVMALAPDLLMVAPHLAAIWLAWRGRAFLSGTLAGVAFLANPKGAFVLLACALWAWRDWPRLLAGFALPNVAMLAWLGSTGALNDYVEQVWRWGMLYSRSTFLDHPILAGITKTLRWMGFQAALVLGAAWLLWKERTRESWRMAAWAMLSLVAVCAGWRFFPRYYFQLLPPMAMMAARGYALLGRKRALLLLALLIPLVRFGPRYVALARDLDHQWSDLSMEQDSRLAAARVSEIAAPGDTLLVWGYRPDVFVYTRLAAATKFLDSQPLTGVIADRHLTSSETSDPALASRNRQGLTRARPTFIVDGLGPFNPTLAIANYPDLRAWLSQYRELARTRTSIIYRRR